MGAPSTARDQSVRARDHRRGRGNVAREEIPFGLAAERFDFRAEALEREPAVLELGIDGADRRPSGEVAVDRPLKPRRVKPDRRQKTTRAPTIGSRPVPLLSNGLDAKDVLR